MDEIHLVINVVSEFPEEYRPFVSLWRQSTPEQQALLILTSILMQEEVNKTPRIDGDQEVAPQSQ